MFIERAASKRILFAPEERNVGPSRVPLPETSRSAGAQDLAFMVGAINIWLRWSQDLVAALAAL
jgi:hypothetical protein